MSNGRSCSVREAIDFVEFGVGHPRSRYEDLVSWTVV